MTVDKKKRPTEPIPLHKVLREVYRRYPEFKEYVNNTGKHVIDHSYYIYEEDLETVKDKITVELSFWDLHNSLKQLSKRKRQAVFYNVIMDLKQKDVADIMGITTVSIGQYVDQSMIQLSSSYFLEENGSYKFKKVAKQEDD